MNKVERAEVVFQPLVSGAWRDDRRFSDYRAEWLSSLLVERGTWAAHAEPIEIDGHQVGAPRHVWFRFWLPEPDQVVEKYFNAAGEPIGLYIPICHPLERVGEGYGTVQLILGVWISEDRRVAVLRENDFDEAIRRRLLDGETIERAENRIRLLTAAIHQEEFPPPLVRNFEINVNQNGDPETL